MEFSHFIFMEISIYAPIGSMLIGRRAQKLFNSIKKIQLTMMVSTFHGSPSASIISCYSPINVNKETVLI